MSRVPSSQWLMPLVEMCLVLSQEMKRSISHQFLHDPLGHPSVQSRIFIKAHLFRKWAKHQLTSSPRIRFSPTGRSLFQDTDWLFLCRTTSRSIQNWLQLVGHFARTWMGWHFTTHQPTYRPRLEKNCLNVSTHQPLFHKPCLNWSVWQNYQPSDSLDNHNHLCFSWTCILFKWNSRLHYFSVLRPETGQAQVSSDAVSLLYLTAIPLSAAGLVHGHWTGVSLQKHTKSFGWSEYGACGTCDTTCLILSCRVIPSVVLKKLVPAGDAASCQTT